MLSGQEKSVTAKAWGMKKKAVLCFGDCLNVTHVILEESRGEETGRQLTSYRNEDPLKGFKLEVVAFVIESS